MFLRSRRFLSSAVRLRTPRPVAVSSLSFTPVALAQFNSRNMSTSVKKTEEEWRAVLSPEQFRILRQKGTEPPGTGEYNKHKAEGVYNCAGCGTPLYKSSTKFDVRHIYFFLSVTNFAKSNIEWLRMACIFRW
ncbi:peptide methionine sulfoxide reductase msrB, variant 3 [Coprinopsis cinerea AmutBmut pab1-1]|nr:peptide methionine sulfoxide reductase msrB, variant 3 [Coprinopsis cinerea AmutBmut pab1-1]